MKQINKLIINEVQNMIAYQSRHTEQVETSWSRDSFKQNIQTFLWLHPSGLLCTYKDLSKLLNICRYKISRKIS